MKNSQRGFVVPLIIVLALLLSGGGVYFYSKNLSNKAPVNNPGEPVPGNNTIDEPNNYKSSDSHPRDSGTSAIFLVSPKDGDTLIAGKTYNINWSRSANFSNVKLEIDLERKLSTDSQHWYYQTIASGLPFEGSYAWTVPEDMVIPGASYNLRVTEPGERGTEIISNDVHLTVSK